MREIEVELERTQIAWASFEVDDDYTDEDIKMEAQESVWADWDTMDIECTIVRDEQMEPDPPKPDPNQLKMDI